MNTEDPVPSLQPDQSESTRNNDAVLFTSGNTKIKITSEGESVEQALEKGHTTVALQDRTRVPNEILGDIFVWTLDEGSVNFPPTKSQHARSPWVLGRVCSRWRQVALNEPRLWNSVHIYLPKAVLARLFWDKRMASLPSDLPPHLASQIDKMVPPSGEEPAWYAHMVDFVISSFPRFKNLTLHLTLPMFPRFLDVPLNSLHALRCFSLEVIDKHRVDDELIQHLRNAVVLRDTPNLRMLEFHTQLWSSAASRASGFLNLPISWQRLTSLDLTRLQCLTLLDVHSFLRECSSVETLRFCVIVESHYDALTDKNALEHQLDLPHLQHVELAVHRISDDRLTRLRLPWERLTTLRLRRLAIPIAALETRYILKKCVSLDQFSCFFEQNQFPDIPEEVVLLPRLTHLTLNVKDGAIFNHLVLPALTSLKIYSNKLPFPALAISNLVIRSGCSLSTLTHSGTSKYDDFPGFRQLLSVISSVHELGVKHLVLDKATMKSIADGDVLPCLKSLAFRLQRYTILKFVDLLERRMQDGGATLHEVMGYISIIETYTPWVEEAYDRIAKLNARYRTAFSLCLKQTLDSWEAEERDW